MPATESTFVWEKMDQQDKEAVLAAHGSLSKNKELLMRIFNLGRPKVIMGMRIDGNNKQVLYCRIAPESVEVMRVLTREYL